MPETSIRLVSDVEMLLKKCEDDPANRERYIQMILNIDPLNKEVQRFMNSGHSIGKGGKPTPQRADLPGISSETPSTKSWQVALLLSIFFGGLGVDRFYLGQIGLGVAKLVTGGGFGFWWLIDAVLIGLKKAKDSNGRTVR